MESETDLIQQWKNDGHFSVDLTLNQGNRFLRDRLKLIETAMEDHDIWCSNISIKMVRILLAK